MAMRIGPTYMFTMLINYLVSPYVSRHSLVSMRHDSDDGRLHVHLPTSAMVQQLGSVELCSTGIGVALVDASLNCVVMEKRESPQTRTTLTGVGLSVVLSLSLVCSCRCTRSTSPPNHRPNLREQVRCRRGLVSTLSLVCL